MPVLQKKDDLANVYRPIDFDLAKKALALEWNRSEALEQELTRVKNALAFQDKGIEKRAAELIIANRELALENDRKEIRAAELIIANKELAFQNSEKEKRAAELMDANHELALQSIERKKVEESIRISQSNLRAIIDNTDATIYSLDLDLCYITFNKKLHNYMRQVHGLDVHQGDKVLDFLDKLEAGHASEWREVYAKALAGGIVKFEKEFKVGEFYSYTTFSIHPIWKKNRVIGISCFSHDITDQKTDQEKLRQSEQQYRNIVETAQEGIWITDKKDTTSFVNKKLCEILGYRADEIIGKQVYDFMSPSDRKAAAEEIREIKSGNSVIHEFRFITKLNKTVWTNLSMSPLQDADGNFTGLLAMVTDITNKILYQESLVNDIIERKKVEENLEHLVQERTAKLNESLLKEKNLVELKSRFISIASHEFRTPLSTIFLASGFIKKYKNKMSQLEIDQKLDTIEKQVGHMTYLLDDVLNVGRADAGKLTVHLTEIPIQIFEELALEAMRASESTHKLQFTIDCSTPTIITDENLLRNIIINLMTNAVKFSEHAKKVEMSVWTKNEKLFLCVKDLGIGIPAEDLDELYVSFSRGSNVGAIEGTGLGLSIVKKAVELLHGTIEIKSILGKSTQFTVSLPFQHG